MGVRLLGQSDSTVREENFIINFITLMRYINFYQLISFYLICDLVRQEI